MDGKLKSFGIVGRVVAMCALLLSAQTTFAATIRCDDCSMAMMQYSAESDAAKRNDYTSPVYVVNLTANAVIKYNISRTVKRSSASGEPPEVVVTGTATAPEPEVAAFVDAASTVMKTRVAMQGDQLPGSVYDHINQPAYDIGVSAYLDNSFAGFVRGFFDFARPINPIAWFKPDAVSVVSKITYADGSTATIAYDYKLKQWVRVPGSERDSQGNRVPITVQDFAGGSTRTYVFTGSNSNQDLLNFLNRAVLLGVPITGALGGRVAHCTVGPGLSGVTCAFTF